jgi:hypothetical protein
MKTSNSTGAFSTPWQPTAAASGCQRVPDNDGAAAGVHDAHKETGVFLTPWQQRAGASVGLQAGRVAGQTFSLILR